MIWNERCRLEGKEEEIGLEMASMSGKGKKDYRLGRRLLKSC
jgi:hypothetical protein